MTAISATVDYSRANNVRSKLQSALDARLLAGARENTPNWDQMAKTVFEASLKASTSADYQIEQGIRAGTRSDFQRECVQPSCPRRSSASSISIR